MLANTVSDREAVLAVYDEYDAVCAQMAALEYRGLSLPELLELQSRRERQVRRAPAVDHALLAEIQTRATPVEIGAKSWADVLAIRLRISTKEAKRRIDEAAVLGPRTTVTGESLAPALPATSGAQAAGEVNAEHVAVIRKFFAKPPVPLDAATHAQIEADLARIAGGNSPEILKQCAGRIAFLLNQDGDEPVDDESPCQGEIFIGPQKADGTTEIRGRLTPEARATILPILSRYGAPGMCNPADEHPCTTGTPSAEAITSDTRTTAERNHDALVAMGRSVLSSGELGEHNGLPVSIVVSTTLRELESRTGTGLTTSGTELPIGDVIRMAAHAHHYLVVYENHRQVPLYLGRAKRVATPGQRIVLHNRDRGCTRPGCTCSTDRCQTHHAKADFRDGGLTDITDLALACPKSNRLVHDKGWRTRIREDGRVEWIPPPLLDTGQDRTNHYWHPEDLFQPPGDDP
ncbi:HNH endonuclease signature motif containing protein [Mycolicibacterium neworleansense]|uniref:REP13E12 repeat protein n=1 Tax=Mycolicibacterium neworleansense TaxID=146018 RepID=A0A0H5RJW2_9MYCO|nr:HNH endonuclease signature motif containing protein [Mycolicibacterium neworleansense]MCV7361752.1 HNH endonuclease [Mycolicibacterium neworleansense]CRZ14056.1 REP13E12 repeat protein [Mycolicibacterium neworleansense]